MIVPVLNRFLHWGAVGLISPVLVLLVMSKGVPVESVGLVLAISSATVVLFELPSGVLSDLIGRRRVYLISLIIGIASEAAILLARGRLGLCLGFALYGVSRAFSSGSIESTYIDDYIARHGKERLHTLITAMGLGETAGLALGCLAGGYVPSLWKRMAPGRDTYSGNLLAQIVIFLGLVVLTLATRYRDGARPRTRLCIFIEESRRLLAGSRVLRLLLMGTAVWGLSFNAIEVYWQPRLRELAGGAKGSALYGLLNGGYFLAAALGSVIVSAAMSRSSGSRHTGNMALAGGLRVAAGASMIALSAQGGVPGFAIFYLATMFLNGMTGIPENTVFAATVPESKRASFMSLASLTMQAGGIVGALAFSAVKRFAPISAIWAVAGSLFAVAALSYFTAKE